MKYEEILHSGKIYHPCEENLAKEQLRRLDMLFEYNIPRQTNGNCRTVNIKPPDNQAASCICNRKVL